MHRGVKKWSSFAILQKYSERKLYKNPRKPLNKRTNLRLRELCFCKTEFEIKDSDFTEITVHL
uniref:Uncharacterized protein n=1 Tax=Anguilla anguilla TaxID=7936 RepID=A0A0E9X261_ANGAN